MANKTISVGQLSDEISSILNSYKDDISDGVDEAVEKSAKKLVKDLREASRSAFGGSGDYAKGWKKTATSKGRGKLGYTVHNKKPGLPHLLEHGHAKVNGGYVSGKPHIAPAESKNVEEFKQEVERVIKDAKP